MNKITIICNGEKNRFDYRLAVYFQGWLMSQLDQEIVSALHEPHLNSYTIHVEKVKNEIHFIVTILNKDLEEAFREVLLDSELEKIELIARSKNPFMIKEINVKKVSVKELTDIFYQKDASQDFTLTFLTPTSFKSEGAYVFIPDIRLILQSLMLRYTLLIEGNSAIDKELLDNLCEETNIVSYRLSSYYFPIHKSFIPGFIGDIKIRCKGNQTLINYLNMLLEFSSYSGVGIKTSLGMGAMTAKQVLKGESYGKHSS